MIDLQEPKYLLALINVTQINWANIMVKTGFRPGAGQAKGMQLPLYSSHVRAGFPSPADDYIEAHLDLNEHLISHQASTFIVRASGDLMTGAGIHSGDLLIVDKSLTPNHGKIVIAVINGELTVKRLIHHQGRIQLLPDKEQYPPMDITEALDLIIWGVVTFIIHETA